MSDMEREALKILARIVGRQPADLSSAQDLVADLGLDSPRALELLCDLEETLDL